MAEAERIIPLPSATRAHARMALPILRISLPMGVSFNGHAGAIDWIQSRFKKGKPATLYYDEIRTPTYTDCLNPLLADVLARRDITGLFHAGGPRRLSLFQIAQIVNRVGGYDPAPPARLPADRSRAAAAAGRRRDDGFAASWPARSATTRSIPGRSTTSTCPRIASGTSKARAARRNCWPRCSIAIPRARTDRTTSLNRARPSVIAIRDFATLR